MPRAARYREAVLGLLEENPIHPTVDWIHVQLRKDHPKVSLATVYRTLRALVREGVLCELPFGTSEARFGLIKEERHYHFICDACRRIFDLRVPPRVRLERAVQKETGHEVTRHTTEFYGRCRECAAKGTEVPSEGERKPGEEVPGRPERGPRGAGSARRKERAS